MSGGVQSNALRGLGQWPPLRLRTAQVVDCERPGEACAVLRSGCLRYLYGFGRIGHELAGIGHPLAGIGRLYLPRKVPTCATRMSAGVEHPEALEKGEIFPDRP